MGDGGGGPGAVRVLETGGKVEHRQRVLSEGSLGQEGMTQSLIPWNPVLVSSWLCGLVQAHIM